MGFVPFYYCYSGFLDFEKICQVFNYFLIGFPFLRFCSDRDFIGVGVNRFDEFLLGIGLHKERYYFGDQAYSLNLALEIFFISFFPLFLLPVQIREIYLI